MGTSRLPRPDCGFSRVVAAVAPQTPLPCRRSCLVDVGTFPVSLHLCRVVLAYRVTEIYRPERARLPGLVLRSRVGSYAVLLWRSCADVTSRHAVWAPGRPISLCLLRPSETGNGATSISFAFHLRQLVTRGTVIFCEYD